MLEADIPGGTFCHLRDAEAVDRAHVLGPGARGNFRLGGRSHPLRGAPLETEFEVVAVKHLALAQSGPMFTGKPLGRSAVLRHGAVHVIIAEGRAQPLNGDIARAHDLMPDLRLIALKSAVHFRAWWKHEATLILDVSTPRLAALELRLIRFTGANLSKRPLRRDPSRALNPKEAN